jgi:ketosteroid isomerase-like protein
MSQENLTALLNASTAANAAASDEERARFLAILDPEVEWIAREGPPDLQGEFRGIDGAQQYYAQWASAWEEWGWEIEEAREQGDLVVTRTRLTGRGRESGLVLDMRIGQTWTFRDGKIVRYEAFSGWEQALEAAGLSE